jgi:hypothetical protein
MFEIKKSFKILKSLSIISNFKKLNFVEKKKKKTNLTQKKYLS